MIVQCQEYLLDLCDAYRIDLCEFASLAKKSRDDAEVHRKAVSDGFDKRYGSLSAWSTVQFLLTGASATWGKDVPVGILEVPEVFNRGLAKAIDAMTDEEKNRLTPLNEAANEGKSLFEEMGGLMDIELASDAKGCSGADSLADRFDSWVAKFQETFETFRKSFEERGQAHDAAAGK